MGDHRAGYIDIDITRLFGEDILRIPRPQARRLATNIPRAMKKYHKLLKKFDDRTKCSTKLSAIYPQRYANISL